MRKLLMYLAIVLTTRNVCPQSRDLVLEKESGGSGRRYSFVISNQKAKHEDGVDAKTAQYWKISVGAKLPAELQSAPPGAHPLF